MKGKYIDEFYKNVEKYESDFHEYMNSKSKRGRKRKNKMYFTPITEKAIIAYNKDKDQNKRNKVYSEYIHYPVWKLAQNIINRFKFPCMNGTTEDKQYEVIGFLLQKLGKFTESKGRAFSYFSIVAKNYCIQTNNKAYKLLKSKINLLAVDRQRDIINEEIQSSRKESLKDFTDLFVESYDKQIENRFSKTADIKIAYAVMELFRRRDNIEKYNKKALYVLIREMTDEKTQDISRVVNTIKRDFKEKFKRYEQIAQR